MTRIFLASIEMWDLKCFVHQRFEFGQAVLVEGENGTGKTSLRRVIENFFLPGGDPSLIRSGCEEGKAIAIFSNGYRAEKVIRRDGYELKVFNPEGGEIKAPATWLMDVLPRSSFDPTPFLDKKDASERAEFLLKTLPIFFEPEEINEVLSKGIGKLPAPQVIAKVPDGKNLNLAEFQAVQEEKRSARTEIGRQRDDFEGTIRSLRSSLPKDEKDDKGNVIEWEARRSSIASHLAEIAVDIQKIESGIVLEAERQRATILKESAEKIEEQRRIIAAAEAEIVRLRGTERQNLVMIEAGVESRKRQATAALEERRAGLLAERAAAAAKANEQTRARGVQDVIEQKEAEFKTFATRYEHYTQILGDLDRLAAQKLKALDIPGFEVRFEKGKGKRSETAQMFVDGLPLDELNRQKALFVAIRLIRYAQKANTSEIQLPLILLESAELTSVYREELRQAVEEAGLQMIVTVPVAEKPLTVRTI